MTANRNGIPHLHELGTDLLHVTRWQKLLTIIYPFLWCLAYFVFAYFGYWPLAVGALVCLSFVTYGSTSHDLAHRNLGLSRKTNDILLFLIDSSILPVYVLLMIMGSWIIPLMTSYIPHNPQGENELSQTRVFRGMVASLLAIEHLYHLEHHLFPSVPHTNWPLLAKRLDPFLAKKGIKPIVFWL